MRPARPSLERHNEDRQRYRTSTVSLRREPELLEDLDDDELLLLSSRRSDAFGVFYQRHAEELLAYFARRTFDADVAAELTAETFATALVARGKYRPDGGAAVRWLFGIAGHQLSRYFRRAAVDSRARRRVGIGEVELTEADYERIDELMDLQRIRRAVGSAFGQLSDDQREAVGLRVVEGRPYREVAEILGLTEQAVRARVARGLRRLGSLLQVDPRLERERT